MDSAGGAGNGDGDGKGKMDGTEHNTKEAKQPNGECRKSKHGRRMLDGIGVRVNRGMNVIGMRWTITCGGGGRALQTGSALECSHGGSLYFTNRCTLRAFAWQGTGQAPA